MQINLIAIGTGMPSWVQLGYSEYVKRLPKEYHFNLIEIPIKKRYKSSNLTELIEQEGKALLTAAATSSSHDYLIALDREGVSMDSETLAQHIKTWQQENRTVNLIIGGPEGLSAACRKQADFIWSLSSLTLPHPLVRVIVAEQLYRAYTILIRHPYHR